MKRFKNKALRDKLKRLVIDNRKKMESANVKVVLDKIRYGLPAHELEYTALGFAGWIRFLQGKDEKGNLIEIDDVDAEELIPLALEAYETGETRKFLKAAFGSRLASQQQFCALVGNYLMQFKTKGVHTTLKE